MTLWNIIRDFFVVNIFGGFSSSRDFYTSNIIACFDDEELNAMEVNTTSNMFPITQTLIEDDNVIRTTQFISLGDWLSTTFTIITLVLLVIFLYIFVKWIFKLFSGLLH